MANAQAMIMGARAVHVRELQAQVARLVAENQHLRESSESLHAHFDLALTAAQDLRNLPEGAQMVIVDGWNLILGAERTARDRDELMARARQHLAEHPRDRVWIVFDGPRFSTVNEGSLRITYTGGSGPHRADKFICDYVRMAAHLGLSERIDVWTNDRDFRKTVTRIRASR